MSRMSRRGFLHTGLAAGAAAAAPAWGRSRFDASFELDEMTIDALQDGLRSGRFTSVEITRRYARRIEEMNARGPELRAVLEINPDAEAIAAGLDAERRAGRVRGPLHGIPILLKDNVDTADRMRTTAGSLALLHSTPVLDSGVAGRLRRAGAVLLGKTNLSEWANIRSTRSSSGWSARGRQCRNPYALDRTPCGSSSGSAVAVSANLCAAAIGTETDGSIVCPSHINGVVGLKPTVGLVSRAGVVPIAHSQDTVGPHARSVRDAAILLTALAGPDARDPATRSIPPGPAQGIDYAAACDRGGLRGARIGVPRKGGFFGYSPATDRVVEDALRVLRAEGAIVIDPADLPDIDRLNAENAELEVLLYELKSDLETYLAGRKPVADGPPIRTLRDVIAFNEAHRELEMPYFGQELFDQAVEKGPLTDPAYVDALAKNVRLAKTEGLDAVFDQYRLDALVAGTGGPAWPIDLVNGDHFLGASSSPAAMAGSPLLNVPAGEAHGLPMGITFMGRPFSEAALIRIGYAFEQATRARRTPGFLRSLDLA